MTICAIHQPNFFPWLGYFDKIRQADIFIFMDKVAYPKSGSGSGSWCNRVYLNVQGQAAWVGCPIQRESGAQLIKDVKIHDRQPWRKKMLRTLEMNYKKAPNYHQAMLILTPLINYETNSLAQFNTHAIKVICDVLGIKSKFIMQSDLLATGQSTELLINLTKAVGATAYMCGNGAAGYQQDHLFVEQNVELIYQHYSPAPYGNLEDFLPGLSVIDFLMRNNVVTNTYNHFGYND